MGESKSSGRKAQHFVRLMLSIGIVLVLAFVGSLAYAKWDLTAEKRHSLTPATIDLLENLKEPVFIRCYLTGELPAEFVRLEQSLKERLDEFSDYSNGLLEYEFIDPYAQPDKETTSRVEEALFESGLRFTRVTYTDKGATASRLVWPAAMLSFAGGDQPIQFFKSDNPAPDQAMINASINNLEFELASNLRAAMRRETPAIGILEGHGELGPLSLADLEQTLAESYVVERVSIDERVDALTEKIDGMKYRTTKFDLLLVAQPDSTFSDRDRVLLDQFLMNGGKIIWMVDALTTSLDSLRENQQTFAMRNALNVYDQLFDYGVRLNRELILDYQCEEIVVDAGPQGNQRNMDVKPWYYAPVITPSDSALHPILTNLGPIRLQFTGSIDTVGSNPAVKKTVLLETSPLSMNLPEPAMVSMGRVGFGLEYFQQNARGSMPTAVLLEGEFTSNFQYRLPDQLANDPDFAFRAVSRPTAQIVIADGDIARNRFQMTAQGPQIFPIGFDRLRRTIYYDNKDFLLNCINYLLDEDALISIRQRTIALRLLNEEETVGNRAQWQVINVAFPLIVVFALGITMRYIRRRIYAS